MPDESKRRERQMATGKSDRVVVPAKSGNSDGGKDATPARRSRRAPSALSGGLTVQTRLDRVARRARTHRTERFNNLFHLLDVELMAECFEELKEDRAPGVDGVTKEEYADGLEHKLRDVVERLHRRRYRPRPTRRKMIPKYPPARPGGDAGPLRDATRERRRRHPRAWRAGTPRVPSRARPSAPLPRASTRVAHATKRSAAH